MLITKECDYAVRILRALSTRPIMSVKEICEQENVTVPFAYKILNRLRQRELVHAYRGAYGGYALVEDARKFTLLDVYLAMEPNLSVCACLHPEKFCTKYDGGDKQCKIRDELVDAQEVLFATLSRKPLIEIVR
ncbi:MAG: RrF2 family transcriptional regulator [Lachnospiraceae bacterium]